MSQVITTLNKKGDRSVEIYPNIKSDNIPANAVETTKINDAAVTTAKIADGGVTTIKIADANVTTAKIADSGVTTIKIADGNITTAKIADGNITTAKINDLAVEFTKLGTNVRAYKRMFEFRTGSIGGITVANLFIELNVTPNQLVSTINNLSDVLALATSLQQTNFNIGYGYLVSSGDSKFYNMYRVYFDINNDLVIEGVTADDINTFTIDNADLASVTVYSDKYTRLI